MKTIKNKKEYNAALQRFEEIFHTKNDSQEAKYYKINTSDVMPDGIKKGLEHGLSSPKKVWDVRMKK